MSLRLRGKPKKPIRKKAIPFEVGIYCGQSVEELLADLPKDMDLSVAEIDYTYGYGRHDVEMVVKYTRIETNEEFAARMSTYKKRLATYEKWYAENKEAIEEETLRRKKEKAWKEEKRLSRQKQKAIAELRKVKKKLEALTNPL